MTRHKWENFGDINHREYGGMFIAKIGETEYAFIDAVGQDCDFYTSDKDYLFIVGSIDLDDVSQEDLKGAARSCGWSLEEFLTHPPQVQVDTLTHWSDYTIDNFSTKNYWQGLRRAKGYF